MWWSPSLLLWASVRKPHASMLKVSSIMLATKPSMPFAALRRSRNCYSNIDRLPGLFPSGVPFLCILFGLTQNRFRHPLGDVEDLVIICVPDILHDHKDLRAVNQRKGVDHTLQTVG